MDDEITSTKTLDPRAKPDDPTFRFERSRKGAAARHSLQTYVKQVVARSHDLTDEQRAELATIFRTGGQR